MLGLQWCLLLCRNLRKLLLQRNLFLIHFLLCIISNTSILSTRLRKVPCFFRPPLPPGINLFVFPLGLREQLLVELVFLSINDRKPFIICRSLMVTALLFLEVMLANFLQLVALNSLLVDFALPQHLIDVVRVTLKVTTDKMLAQ